MLPPMVTQMVLVLMTGEAAATVGAAAPGGTLRKMGPHAPPPAPPPRLAPALDPSTPFSAAPAPPGPPVPGFATTPGVVPPCAAMVTGVMAGMPLPQFWPSVPLEPELVAPPPPPPPPFDTSDPATANDDASSRMVPPDPPPPPPLPG